LAEPQSINDTETKAWEVEGIGHNDFTPVNLGKTFVSSGRINPKAYIDSQTKA